MKTSKIKLFDDVRIKSKNSIGYVVKIEGDKYVIKTLSGLVEAEANDLEKVENID